MALRLVLVFRPVSPLSGHSHAAGRRGSPTLSPGLGPVRHTSLELQSQKLFSLCSLRLDEHLYYADPYERRGALDGGLRRLDVKELCAWVLSPVARSTGTRTAEVKARPTSLASSKLWEVSTLFSGCISIVYVYRW